MPNLIETIKIASLEAVAATNPVAFVYGTVKGTEPLEIAIGQKLTLTAPHLKVTAGVTEYETSIRQPGETASTPIVIDNRLAVGDGVLLAKCQGGQQYIVLDKVR